MRMIYSMKRKVALVVACIVCLLTASAAAAADLTVTINTGASVTLKDADGDGYYDIGTADELYAFAAAVNGGNTAINGELTTNIVVNEGTMSAETTDARPWTPIGGFDRKYTGTFNGADYTISGLYFNDGTADYVGLFGYVGNGAAVQNITIADSYLSGQRHVGGVMGKSSGTVSNCINSSEIVGSKYNTGGVVGLNDGTVTGCTNSGAVSGKDYFVGGIVGQNAGTVSGCINSGNVTGSDDKTGGVVGTNLGTVTDCTNRGTVSGNSSVGGVVGKSSGTVSGCTNSGGVSGNSSVGGVVGENGGDGTVTNCHNTATVIATYTGNSSVGGVVGYNNESVVSNCYNTGAVNGNGYYVGGVVGLTKGYEEGSTVTNCYNTGKVTSTASSVGGVAGSNTVSIKNCYYLDTAASGGVDGADAVGQAEAKTSEQFASGEVAYLLQGSQAEAVWGQNIDNGETVQPLPVLSDATVYAIQNCKNETLYSNTNGNIGHKWENGICTVCGTPCDHKDSTHETATNNGNGTHSITCTVCQTAATEDHTLTDDANDNVITNGCSKCEYVTATATITATNATYDGTAQETATVAYGTGWTGDRNLTVTYANNVDAGTATASITLGGVTARTTFTIQPKEITGAAVAIEQGASFVYSGEPFTPAVSVTLDGKPLAASDYQVSYAGNVNAGQAMVTVTGRGNYSGSATATFTIAKAPAPTLPAATVSRNYAVAKVSVPTGIVAGEGSSVSVGTASGSGSDKVAAVALDAKGNLTFTLSGGANGDEIVLPVHLHYSPNYEGPITATVTVTLTDKLDQRPLTVKATSTTVPSGGSLELSIGGGSGKGEVTYEVINGTGSASLSGSTLTGGAPGTVTVIATKEGTSQYNPARSQPLVITIE